MPEIDPQLLQQRRFPFIPFRPKRRQPPRSQPPLFPHPSTHTLCRSAAAAEAHEAGPGTRTTTVGIALGLAVRVLRSGVAVRVLGGGGLGRGAVARDGGRVGGLVEVEGLGGRVVGGGGLGVVLGHGGLEVGVDGQSGDWEGWLKNGGTRKFWMGSGSRNLQLEPSGEGSGKLEFGGTASVVFKCSRYGYEASLGGVMAVAY